jgi:hypothetical protein
MQAGRPVVDSCSDIKQDARKNGILLLVLADERIPRLQVLVDKWKYNIAMMNQDTCRNIIALPNMMLSV